jgi:hypothetical protein
MSDPHSIHFAFVFGLIVLVSHGPAVMEFTSKLCRKVKGKARLSRFE